MLALTQTIQQMIRGLKQALSNNNLTAEVFICQNDGTLMNLEKALRYPVLTIGAVQLIPFVEPRI